MILVLKLLLQGYLGVFWWDPAEAQNEGIRVEAHRSTYFRNILSKRRFAGRSSEHLHDLAGEKKNLCR